MFIKRKSFTLFVLLGASLFSAENPIDPSVPVEIADEVGTSIDVGSSSSHYTIIWNKSGDVTAAVSTNLEEAWGAPVVIGTDAPGSRPVKVTSNASGSLVAYPNDDGSESVAVVFYNAGTEIWGAPVNITLTLGEGEPAADNGIIATEDGFYLTWQDIEGDYYIAFTADGVTWEPAVFMGHTDDTAVSIEIAIVGDLFYVVAIEDDGASVVNVLVSFVSSDGGQAWTPGYTTSSATLSFTELALVGNSTGFFIAINESDTTETYITEDGQDWDQILGVGEFEVTARLFLAANDAGVALTLVDDATDIPYVYYMPMSTLEWSDELSISPSAFFPGVAVTMTSDTILFGWPDTPPSKIYASYSPLPENLRFIKDGNTFTRRFQFTLPSRKGFIK